MSALLLLMCGVGQDAVVEDYVQSEANLKVWFPTSVPCIAPMDQSHSESWGFHAPGDADLQTCSACIVTIIV
jgi:hypothetical protein